MHIDSVDEYCSANRLKIIEFLKGYDPTRVVLDRVYVNNLLHAGGHGGLLDIARQHLRHKVDDHKWSDVLTDKDWAFKWAHYLVDDELYLMKELNSEPNSDVRWRDIYAPSIDCDYMYCLYDASSAILVKDYIIDNIDEIQDEFDKQQHLSHKKKEHKVLSCFNSTKIITTDVYSVDMNEPLMAEVVKLLKYTTVIPQEDM